MNLTDIHFHDSRILRVVEDTAADTLTMEVEYPVDWDQNRFERRCIVFFDTHNYQAFEQPFVGPPTILDADVVGARDRWIRVRLKTNVGFREVSCVSVSLSANDHVT